MKKVPNNQTTEQNLLSVFIKSTMDTYRSSNYWNSRGSANNNSRQKGRVHLVKSHLLGRNRWEVRPRNHIGSVELDRKIR